ncbi:HotDog domain-containing protein [Obelidium mucronatum]|nr:HotDog domain-containing protein [Obelidium mucronatum]
MTSRLNQLRSTNAKITGSLSSASTAAAAGSTIISGEKRMKDSFVQAFLPFRSDPGLKEEYINSHNRIRVGMVLEDLDCLAATAAYMHCAGSERPLTIVTASVDRMEMLSEIPLDRDISVFAYVTYVGKSSMEVTVQMETVLPDSGVTPDQVDASTYRRSKLPAEMLSGDLILSAKFIMVARDSETGKAASVHQLNLETDQERSLFRQGAEHKARKQVETQTSLSLRPPSVEEMTLVHDLYKEYSAYRTTRHEMTETSAPPPVTEKKPSNVVWMKDTNLQQINLTFPQDRNLHNKIFGGFLMRRAYELSIVTGMTFCKKALQFKALDDISFRKPVEIGAILDLHSQVVYTRGQEMVIKVVAHIVDPASEGRLLSNEFWFTFVVAEEDRAKLGSIDYRVMPRSYNDCMLYLEGKRRLEN